MSKKKSFKLNMLTLIIPIVILLDQLSKIIVTSLLGENSVDFLFFHFRVIGNTGFAFGLNSGSNIANVIIALVFIIVIVRFLITQKHNIIPKVQAILYLILGGAISNIIDRVVRGSVVDFIGVASFPVFNVADICIVVGWCLFIFSLVTYAINKQESKIKDMKKEER